MKKTFNNLTKALIAVVIAALLVPSVGLLSTRADGSRFNSSYSSYVGTDDNNLLVETHKFLLGMPDCNLSDDDLGSLELSDDGGLDAFSSVALRMPKNQETITQVVSYKRNAVPYASVWISGPSETIYMMIDVKSVDLAQDWDRLFRDVVEKYTRDKDFQIEYDNQCLTIELCSRGEAYKFSWDNDAMTINIPSNCYIDVSDTITSTINIYEKGVDFKNGYPILSLMNKSFDFEPTRVAEIVGKTAEVSCDFDPVGQSMPGYISLNINGKAYQASTSSDDFISDADYAFKTIASICRGAVHRYAESLIWQKIPELEIEVSGEVFVLSALQGWYSDGLLDVEAPAGANFDLVTDEHGVNSIVVITLGDIRIEIQFSEYSLNIENIREIRDTRTPY